MRIARGYIVIATGEGERILTGAITERFASVGGEYVPITQGSTLPVAETRTHAGVVKVQRFAFDIP
jgi:hypothetical protein